MFGLNRNAADPLLTSYPGAINEAGGMRPLLPGPLAGDDGPSTIRVTDPGRFGMNPFGRMMAANRAVQSPAPAMASTPPGATAAANSGGMFAGKAKHKLDLGSILGMLLQGAIGYEAGRGVPGAAEQLQSLNSAMQYRMKKRDSDAQTATYVQALVANGMDPSLATIMAADPSEMSKHIGTRFDAGTIDEGSSRYVPNLNGSANVFTAPKTFTHGADVVQMPGSQTVAPAFGSLDGQVGIPQPLGAPTPVPGLRTDAEQYAASLGLVPGTDPYESAVQDYSLKAYGPSAQSMLGQRLDTQRNIAYHRDATSTANNVRSTGTSASNNRRSTSQSNINSERSAQTARGGYAYQHGGGKRGFGVQPNEPVAVGPKGQKIVVRNGRWVDAATGKPVQ